MRLFNPLKTLLLVAGLAWQAGILHAQVDTVGNPLPPITKETYLKSYWTNGISLLKEPFTWRGEEWIPPAASILITGATVTLDEPLNVVFEKISPATKNTVADIGDWLGGPPIQFAISAAPIAIGAITHNKKWIDFGTDNMQAQIFAGGMSFVVKELTHRARPNTGEGAFAWYGPFDKPGNTSFYSGHTTLAFATATMIYLHSNRKWWVAVVSYSLASGVGISRIMAQKHWTSDVVAGAIMGSAVSSFVYYQQEKRRKNNLQLLKPLP